MQYTYDAQNPNLLLKVFDYSNSPQGFKDDGDGISDHENDYKYDTFGNLIKDDNKNIESITYNHLNLPVQINFANGSNINYLYNATGQKLKKVVNGNETITTDYLAGFQYHNGSLRNFPHAEGYINVVNGKFKHVFNFTDHLGNIRLSYSDANRDNFITQDEILEENNFYPFGLKHTAYNTNERQYINNDQINELILILLPRFTGDGSYNYKYNGKEYQDELGLNMYDYGARNYDPALGRWMNIDPMAEIYRRHTPYAYAVNNPLRFIDPDGMKVEDKVIDEDKDKVEESRLEAKGIEMEEMKEITNQANEDFKDYLASVSNNNSESNNDSAEDAEQKAKNTLYDLFNAVLKLKSGTVINIDKAIKDYGLDPNLKDAINSIKVVGKNQIYVDWNSEKKINALSYINVKDGILNVQSVKLPAGNNKVYYGIKITGGNLQIDTSGTFTKGQIYNNLFLTPKGALQGIIKETKNSTTFTDKQYEF